MGNAGGRTGPRPEEFVNMDAVLKGLYIGGFLGKAVCLQVRGGGGG